MFGEVGRGGVEGLKDVPGSRGPSYQAMFETRFGQSWLLFKQTLDSKDGFAKLVPFT